MEIGHKNVYQGIDLVVPVYFNHGVDGAMFTSGLKEKQITLSVGVTAICFSKVEMGLFWAT